MPLHGWAECGRILRLTNGRRLQVSLWKRFEYWRQLRAFRKEARSFYAKNDPIENLETTPPDEERISFRCLWTIEYFTPSSIRSLEEGIVERDWDRLGLGGGKLLATVRNWRQGTGGGWHVVGSFGPPQNRRPGLAEEAGFPQGVEAASLEVHSVTPGITALLGMFVMNEEGSRGIDDALRHNYSTQLERVRGGQSILQPGMLKERASRQLQRDAAKRCFKWMTNGMRGAFSSTPDLAPCWAFVTFAQARPFSDQRTHYLQAVGASGDFEAWYSRDLPGLRFSSPSYYPADDDSVLMAANDEDLAADPARPDNERLHRLNLQFHRTIVAWGVTRLLAADRRRLADVRHAIALTAKTRRGATARLFSARESLLTEGADIRHSVIHLRRYSENKEAFTYDMPEFEPVRPEVWRDPTSYPETVRLITSEQAEILGELEAEVRELLTTSSAVESAAVNLRLQRTLLWLTFALVALGLATIWAAFWVASHPSPAG
jgi:hypothetical protein